MNINTYFSLFLASLFFAGCAGIQPGASESVYNQALLNATYYGAYYRPISIDNSPSQTPDRATREQERNERRATREQERNERRQQESPQNENEAHEMVATTQLSTPQLSESIPESHRNTSANATESAAYVEAVYALNDTPVTDSSVSTSIVNMYRHADNTGTIYHSTTPAIGDLVFFHNTSDRNGDGRNNDWFAHVGIVESVNNQGTISVLSYLNDEVSRIYMNLEYAEEEERDGVRINSSLRVRNRNDPEYTRYLAGELFAGFGSLLGSRTEVMVLDSWSPESGNSMTASR